jgi:hypothetical protein
MFAAAFHCGYAARCACRIVVSESGLRAALQGPQFQGEA